ncbi:aminotransferase class I/II-fold pyridoxal phosphate-dependent enzyme [Paradesulfitobacterium aromaticivorans]
MFLSVLGDGLSRYLEQGFCSFHTPGHKGRQEFFCGLDFPAADLTELPGLDMLHAPAGIIAEAQAKAARIFGAEESFFLVNGATVGNQALFMAIPDNKPVLISRSAHRSVFSGLILSGHKVKYLRPVIHPDFNLPLGLEVNEVGGALANTAACHLTYPTYYGSCCDLGAVLEVRNRDNYAIPMLVDQAHGSHYLGALFPPSALTLGADAVVHSTHKTLSALTQGAMLHVQGSLLARERLRQALELLQSSSPSYLLLASLERGAESALVQGHWEALQTEVEEIHRSLGGSLRILSAKDEQKFGIALVDWSRILVNTRPLGVAAPVGVKFLRKRFGIEPELWDDENILFVLGIGSKPSDIRLLRQGLESLCQLKSEAGAKLTEHTRLLPLLPPVPPQRLTPRQAFLAPKRLVPLSESLGHIAGETISPYPPGIPVVVMGEEVTGEVLEILRAKGEGRWQGWERAGEERIWVVEDE